MRILQVLEASVGGAGRHVIDLSMGLAERGHEVHLAYSPTRAEPSFVEEIRAADKLQLHTIPMRRGPHPSDFSALLALRRLIRQSGGFDVVHGHSSKAGALVRMLRVTGVKSKLFYTPHGVRTFDPELSPTGRTVWSLIERTLNFLGGNLTIAVSGDEYRHILAQKISRPDRLQVVMNGLAIWPATNRSEVRDRFGLKTDDVCVGYVGRLHYLKGPLHFVDAFARVVQSSSNANVKAIMLGSGEMESEVRQRILQHKIEDRISIHTNERGSACMCAFDTFALTSIQEALPYVLLEAAAAQLPIVATNVGGVSTVVENESNGLIVPTSDVEGFARALGRLTADSELRDTMSEKATAKMKNFRIDRMLDELAVAYGEEPMDANTRHQVARPHIIRPHRHQEQAGHSVSR